MKLCLVLSLVVALAMAQPSLAKKIRGRAPQQNERRDIQIRKKSMRSNNGGYGGYREPSLWVQPGGTGGGPPDLNQVTVGQVTVTQQNGQSSSSSTTTGTSTTTTSGGTVTVTGGQPIMNVGANGDQLGDGCTGVISITRPDGSVVQSGTPCVTTTSTSTAGTSSGYLRPNRQSGSNSKNDRSREGNAASASYWTNPADTSGGGAPNLNQAYVGEVTITRNNP
ncbi:expressed unknown protein [Seminavis robusta]|uniref:Uncharacterized protein n=1 Tax=Seminavis robusta TaxID=568900 RepID=A0A9N8E3T3_9STRA|nr:expressed unknown protein [Seminavis robusta]|eukprot:Sro589_g171820.1 n/a (223) ;mRNA; f:48512-49180